MRVSDVFLVAIAGLLCLIVLVLVLPLVVWGLASEQAWGVWAHFDRTAFSLLGGLFEVDNVVTPFVVATTGVSLLAPIAGARARARAERGVGDAAQAEAVAASPTAATSLQHGRRESSQFAVQKAWLQEQMEAEAVKAQEEKTRRIALTNKRQGVRQVNAPSVLVQWLGFVQDFALDPNGMCTLAIPAKISDATFARVANFLQVDGTAFDLPSRPYLVYELAIAADFLQIDGLRPSGDHQSGEYHSSKDLMARIAVKIAELETAVTVDELQRCTEHALKLMCYKSEQFALEKRATIIEGLTRNAPKELCKFVPLLTSIVIQQVSVDEFRTVEFRATMTCLAKCIGAPAEELDPCLVEELCRQVGETVPRAEMLDLLDAKLNAVLQMCRWSCSSPRTKGDQRFIWMTTDTSSRIKHLVHAARQIVAIYIRAYHNTDYLAALDLIDHYAPRTIQGEQDECSLSERTGQEIMVKIKLRGAIRLKAWPLRWQIFVTELQTPRHRHRPYVK